MKEIAADTMKATYMRLSPTKREHNFELFGLDFMLDEDMNVYLIEVNTNPCLEVSCPLLGKLLSGLLENLFKYSKKYLEYASILCSRLLTSGKLEKKCNSEKTVWRKTNFHLYLTKQRMVNRYLGCTRTRVKWRRWGTSTKKTRSSKTRGRSGWKIEFLIFISQILQFNLDRFSRHELAAYHPPHCPRLPLACYHSRSPLRAPLHRRYRHFQRKEASECAAGEAHELLALYL